MFLPDIKFFVPHLDELSRRFVVFQRLLLVLQIVLEGLCDGGVVLGSPVRQAQVSEDQDGLVQALHGFWKGRPPK